MINVTSVFTGAGALDYAFQLTGGFSTIASFDVQPDFCTTVTSNQHTGLLDFWPTAVADARDLTTNDLRPATHKKPVGLIGGPPCESFSSMGLKKGHSDPRGTLVFTFARLAASMEADFFVMENVPALITANGGSPFRDLLKEFTRSGFTVTHSILCAADYGAMTVRKRVVIVGLRNAMYRFPAPTHGPRASLPWHTVRDALSGLPPPADRGPGQPQAHVRVKHTDEVRRRFASLKPGSYDNVRKRSRLSWDKPSPSLVAGDLRGIRSHIHPEQPRELTSRESARIQGFPDAFTFSGSPAAIGKQIANAVPIPLGIAIATALREQLKDIP